MSPWRYMRVTGVDACRRGWVAVSLAWARPTDTLDAAAVAWSAWRIATGQAVVVPGRPEQDSQGREIAIRY